jgi:CBS domain-containing protein
MKVKEVMVTDVKVCTDYDALSVAAEIMWDFDCGSVPVLDKDGHVIAVVTDRDVCMAAFFQGLPLDRIPVTAAMSKEIYFCRADDDLAMAEALMCELQIRRLPVVDSSRRIVGILALNDLAREEERERTMRMPTQISAGEIAQVLAAVCKSRRATAQPPKGSNLVAVTKPLGSLFGPRSG